MVKTEAEPTKWPPPSVLYDAYENGFGEDPGSDVPGELVVSVPGLGVKDGDPDDKRPVREIVATLQEKVSLETALETGTVGDIRNRAEDAGKSVGFRWMVNRVEVFIAESAEAIIAHKKEVAIGAAGVVGATIFTIGGIHLLGKRQDKHE